MNDSKSQFSLRTLFLVIATVAVSSSLVFYATVNIALCVVLMMFLLLAGLMYSLLVAHAPIPHKRATFVVAKCPTQRAARTSAPTVSQVIDHL